VKFVWWSHRYHFTTDIKGELIDINPELDPNDAVKNPIEILPFVNFSKDQDGEFWALGGEDLVDGSILINQLLADTYFIQKLQGQGIFYMAGKGLPEKYKVGPSDAIVVKKEEGDPPLDIGFASSNPNIDASLNMIEQQLALILSTNNLEPGTIQGDLSATTAASGIQEIIRRSENLDNLTDQQELYRDNEPLIMDLIVKWHNLLFEKQMLDDDVRQIGSISEEASYSLKFPEPQVYKGEKEELEVIEKRRELKLDTMIDSIMRDNPDLTREEAEAKYLEILEEKQEIMKVTQQMFRGKSESTPTNGDQDTRTTGDKEHTADEREPRESDKDA